MEGRHRRRAVGWIWCRFMSSLFAYLDPGTGSILIQALLGGVAALGVVLKVWRHRIASFLRIQRKKDSPADR